jgi:hypothetical protein
MANEEQDKNQTDVTTEGDKGKGTEDKGKDTTTPEVISMSNADLAKRLERQAKSARAALLKELGVESVDALKAKLTTPAKSSEADDVTSARIAEMESKLETVTKFAEAAQKETEALKAKARQTALLNTLKGAVKTLRLHETVAEDLLGWATVKGRDTSKLLKEDLTPDQEQLDALIKDARTERPDWFKTARVGSPSIAGLPPTEADQKRKQAAADAQWSALKRGG